MDKELLQEYANRVKQKFTEDTWLDLFEASTLYYEQTLFKVENDEQLVKFIKDCEVETLECIDELKKIIKRKNGKENTKVSIIERARDYSILRCNPNVRAKRERTTAEAEEMFPKEILIKNLSEVGAIAFNPLCYYNWIQGKVKCIFKPSRKLCNRHPWLIDKIYYWWSTIYKYALIDLNMLHTFPNINITEDDIEDIHYSFYHPILRSWIANKDFSKFKLQ